MHASVNRIDKKNKRRGFLFITWQCCVEKQVFCEWKFITEDLLYVKADKAFPWKTCFRYGEERFADGGALRNYSSSSS